jgi:molecular chaperone DnaJ
MDLYVILGVERSATVADIKRAYKRLARRYHPDINPGDRMAAAQFREIAEAYETLIDPERRRVYDTAGVVSTAPGSTFGFEGFDFSMSVSGASAPTFGDLFADVFQSRATRDAAGAERGADLHQTIALSFEEAMRGGQRTVTVTREERCRLCRGEGRLRTSESQCLHCQGTGTVRSVRGHMVFSKPCDRCAGRGQIGQTMCPACAGRRTEMRTESLTVAIPPGLASGARVRVPGKGHTGLDDGANGDLYIEVTVAPHPVFRRDGNDLHLTVPIAVHEAALGAKVEIPSLEGAAKLRVPPGTQSGQRFRLRERGVPSPRADGRRGDLVVEVRIVLPKLLDERSKDLLREFGRINGEDVRKDLIK